MNFNIAIQIASAAFAKFAAILWFKASLIETPVKLKRIVVYQNTEDPTDGYIGGELDDLMKAVSQQSAWIAQFESFVAAPLRLRDTPSFYPLTNNGILR